MKKVNQFETFNDGLCSLYMIDDDGNPGGLKERLRFQERTVGYKRYNESMTNKVQIDRLIRVPHRPWLTTEYLAVIEGQIYEIKLAQTIVSTTPRTTDLSLHFSRQREV